MPSFSWAAAAANEEDEREVLIKLSISSAVIREQRRALGVTPK